MAFVSNQQQMDERILMLLAYESIEPALSWADLLDVLSPLIPDTEVFLSVLEVLIRPASLTAIVNGILEEPQAPERVCIGDPTYEEYGKVYRSQWLLCISNFSAPLLASILNLRGATAREFLQRLAHWTSHDPMNLEAYTRFLNAFMDQYSPESLLDIFDALEPKFLQGLLSMISYEPMRDVMLRIFNELPDTRASLHPFTYQLLDQLFPQIPIKWQPKTEQEVGFDSDRNSHPLVSTTHERMHKESSYHQFTRMMHTCDLITDLIHEKRMGSIGYFYVQQLQNSREFAEILVENSLVELRALPNELSVESYGIKILNSLLQQFQCGCVAVTSQFMHDLAQQQQHEQQQQLQPPEQQQTEGNPLPNASSDATNGPIMMLVDSSPPLPSVQDHTQVPALWNSFLDHMSSFLDQMTNVSIKKKQHLHLGHLQLVYLMLPILCVSCSRVDRVLIEKKIMEALLDLVISLDQASVLHCAVSRLFIVCLEDAPFMFGKELPTLRSRSDPLRRHLILNGCLDQVMRVAAHCVRRVRQTQVEHAPSVLIDVAISFDQAVSNTQGLPSEVQTKWAVFREQVLLKTQKLWEEQPIDSDPMRGSQFHLLEEDNDSNGGDATVSSEGPCVGHVNAEEAESSTATPNNELKGPTGPILQDNKTENTTTNAGENTAPVTAAETVTPLSALYNEEEKNYMLRYPVAPVPVAATTSEE